jgi:hypothetical protein
MLSADYASLIRPTRNSKNASTIASFVVEYSAHFVVKIFRAFTPSGFSRTAFHIAVRTVARLSFFAVRYPIG